jgi:hypothetical protein
MKISTQITVCVLLTIGAAADGLADCTGGASIDYVEGAYAEAQAQERAGKLKDALSSYVEAQAYICERSNPVELAAAREAARIAKPLAAAEEQKGHFDEAAKHYEMGGYYADSDRAQMANVRVHPDDPRYAEVALQWLYNHGSPSHQVNNRVRLSVTGPYAQDPKLVPELKTIVIKGIDRALQRESAAFNEQYLKEYVELTQARPESENVTVQLAYSQRWGAFQQKWPEDLLDKSRAELEAVRAWANVLGDTNWDRALADATVERSNKRAEERAAGLEQRYSGAPKLLEEAITYHEISLFQQSRFSDATDAERGNQEAEAKRRVQQVKAQAIRLGDEASAKERLGLAYDYYVVGDDDAKAHAAEERKKQLFMAKHKTEIDEASRDMDAIKAAYSDPAKREAMKKQAQEAAKAMQEQKPDKKERAKKADELEAELGL